ncbi:MAG: FliA/WhiG family RNA polymerase sigma factor [Candidatus Cloacimonetes bacterium]|nr:FliA/WhiG family RNA polymerase sigma factor [Candidatus Cloacimonadota bacterium]
MKQEPLEVAKIVEDEIDEEFDDTTDSDSEESVRVVSSDDQEDLRLWQAYKETGDPKVRELLILKYSPFVKYVAGRMAVNLPSNVEYEDLISYGVFGLIDAIERYDTDRAVQFKTYAKTRIRGAILDELRVLDWTPRSVRQKARKLEKAYAHLESEMGRQVTDEEVAAYLEITIEELQKLVEDTRQSLVLSLDETEPGSDNSGGGPQSRLNFFEDVNTPTPEQRATNREVKKMLAESINKLSDRERLVVTLIYFEDMTAKEIGQILGVSDSRVSQLHTKAILRLRGRLGKVKRLLLEE